MYSIAAMVEKIMDKAGTSGTDELIELLHQGNFNLSVSEKRVKIRVDYQLITLNVI